MTAPERGSAVGRAAAWLRSHLDDRGGTARAADVLAAGALAGYPARTLRRACVQLSVTATRHGFGGGTAWALPVDERSGHRSGQRDEVASARPDGEASRTVSVPSGVDARGRTEWAEVSSPEAASMWDSRTWRSFDEW